MNSKTKFETIQTNRKKHKKCASQDKKEKLKTPNISSHHHQKKIESKTKQKHTKKDPQTQESQKSYLSAARIKCGKWVPP